MYFEYLRSFNKSVISYTGDKRLYEGDYYYGMLFFRKSFISNVSDIPLFKILSISDNFGYEYFDNVRFLCLLSIANLSINYVLHPLPVVYFNPDEEEPEEPEEPTPENDLYDPCGMFYNLCSRDDYIINNVDVTVDYNLDNVQTICVLNEISQEYTFSYVQHNVSIDITINYILGNVYAKFIFVSEGGPSYISPSFSVSNGVNNYSFVIPSYIGDVSGFLYVYVYKSIDDFECQMYRKIFYTRRVSSRKFRSVYTYNCLNNQNNYSFIFNRVMDPTYYTERYLIYYDSSSINPLITGSNVHFSISSVGGTITVNTYPYSIIYNPNSYSFVIEKFNINISQSIHINRTFLVSTNYITYFTFDVSNVQSVEVNLLLNNSVLASNTYNVNPYGDTVSDSISYTSFDPGMILHVRFYIDSTCYVECYYYLSDYLMAFDVLINYYLDNNTNNYNLDISIQAYNHSNISLDYVYTFYNTSGGGGSLTYSDTSNNTGFSSTSFSLPLGGSVCDDVQSFIGTDYYLVNNVINSNIITNQSTYTISYINNSFLSQNLLQIDIYYGSGLIFSFVTNVDSNNVLIYYPDLRFYIVASYQHYYNILDITILPVNSSYTIISADISVNYVQSSNSVNIYNGTVSNNIGNGINFSTCLSDTITGIDYLYLYGTFNISSPNYSQNINLSFCFDLNRVLSPAANFDLPLCAEYHEDNSIIVTHEIRYGIARCGDYIWHHNYNNFTLHPNNDFTIEDNQHSNNYLIIHYKLHNGYNVNDLQNYRARIRFYTIPNYAFVFQTYSEEFFNPPASTRYYPDYLNLTVTSYPAFDESSRLLQYHGTTPPSNFPFLEHYDFQGYPVLSFLSVYSGVLVNPPTDLLIVVDIVRYVNNAPQCIVNRKSFIYRNAMRNSVKITYKDIVYDDLGFPVSYSIRAEWDLKSDEWIYLLSNAHGNPYIGVCTSNYILFVASSVNSFPLPNSYSYIYYNYVPLNSSSVYELQNHQIYSNSHINTNSIHLFSRSVDSILCNTNNIDFVINKITIMYTEYWLTRFFIILTEDFIFATLLSHFLDNEIATITFNDINVSLNITHHPNRRIGAGKFYLRPNRYYNDKQNSIYIQRPSFNYYINIEELEVIKLNIVYLYNRRCDNIRFSNIHIYLFNRPNYFVMFIGTTINVRVKKLNDQNYDLFLINTGISSLVDHPTYASGNINLCSYVNNTLICPEVSYDNRPNIDNNSCNYSGNTYEIHSRILISASNSELIFLYHLNDPDFVNYYLESEIKYHGFILRNFITPHPYYITINEENPLDMYSPSVMPFIYRHTPFYSHFKVKVTTTETSPGSYSILIEFLADYLINDPSDPAVIGYVTYDNPATYTGTLDIYCNGNLIHTVNLTNASTYTYNTNDPCLSPTSWQEKYILLRPTSPSTSYTFRDDQNRTYSCDQDTVLCMTYSSYPQIPPCPNGDCNNTIKNDFQNVEAKMIVYYLGFYGSQINLSSNTIRQYNADLDTQGRGIYLLLEVPSGYNYTDISVDVSIYDINTLSLVQSYNLLYDVYYPNYQAELLTLSNFNNKPVMTLYQLLSSSIQDGYYLLVTDIKYTDPVTSTTCCARRLVNILRVLQYRTLTLDIIHSGSCENSDTDTTLTLQEVLPYVPEDKVEYIIYDRNIQQTNYGTPQLVVNTNNLQRFAYSSDGIGILLYPTTYPSNPYSNDLVLEHLGYGYPSFIEPEFILHITSDYFFAFCVFSVDSSNYAFSVDIGSNSFNVFNIWSNILYITSGINLINTNNVSYSLSYSNMGIIVNSSPFSYTCSGTYTVMQITKTVSLSRNYDIVSINGLQINISNNVNSVSFNYYWSNISLQSYDISSSSFSNISNILTGYSFTITTTHSISLSHSYQLTPTPNTGNTSCTFHGVYGPYLPIYQRTVLTNNASTYTCRFDIFDPNYVNYVVRFDYSVQYTYQSNPYSIASLYRIISHYTHYYVVVTIQNNGGNNNTITINFLCDYWETDGYNMTLLRQGQPAYYTGRIRFRRGATLQYNVVHTNVSSVSFNCNNAQCNPTNTTNRYVILGANNERSFITAPGRETLQLTNNNVIGLCMINI